MKGNYGISMVVDPVLYDQIQNSLTGSCPTIYVPTDCEKF